MAVQPLVLSEHGPRRLWRWEIFVWTLMVAFTAYFFWYSVVKAQVYDSYSHDLANMWQTSWNVAHGHGFAFTYPDSEMQVARLAIHSDYILILLAPLTWVWDHWSSFLLVQALVVGGGAWLVWRIGLTMLGGPGRALTAAVAYLAYGPLLYPLLWQFHGVTLAVTFILGATEAIINHRRRWVFWVWFGLALITKEQVGFLIGLWSAWLWWRQGQRTLAWWSLGIGWVYSLVHFLVIIPSWRLTSSHFAWQFYYGDLAGNDTNRLSQLLNPSLWWERLSRPTIGTNLLLLLVPLAFLPLLSPWTLLVILAILPTLLAHDSGIISLYFQNYILAVPFLVCGMIDGWRRIDRWLSRRGWLGPTWAQLAVVLIWVGVGTIAISPWPWSLHGTQAYRLQDPRLATLERLHDQVPPNASVAYSKASPPIFRDRQFAYVLPYGLTSAEYIVVFEPKIFYYTFPKEIDRTKQQFQDLRQYLRGSQVFTKVYDDDQTLVYHRNLGQAAEPVPASLVTVNQVSL